MKILYFLLFLISFSVLAESDILLRKKAYVHMNKYYKEFNNGKDFVIKEKSIIITKMQDRRILKKYIKGYLGAKFNSNIDKIPYSYAYVVNHSSGKVLNDFILNNDLFEIRKNKKDGISFNLKINDFMKFDKIEENTYFISTHYTILDYKNKFKFRTKYKVKILNRNPFNFVVLEEDTQLLK
jgi:hypothetical protein